MRRRNTGSLTRRGSELPSNHVRIFYHLLVFLTPTTETRKQHRRDSGQNETEFQELEAFPKRYANFGNEGKKSGCLYRRVPCSVPDLGALTRCAHGLTLCRSSPPSAAIPHFNLQNTRLLLQCLPSAVAELKVRRQDARLDMTTQRRDHLWKALLCCAAVLMISHTGLSQTSVTVVIPRYADKYSKLVQQLEGGDTNVDYREFRDSFLDSEQFKVAANQKPVLDTLRTTMHELMKESKYAEIVDVAKKILSIDYTDMEAHKILQQTYKILGDAPNQKKYHDIEFGLLNSIVKSGDGKTCQSAWP